MRQVRLWVLLIALVVGVAGGALSGPVAAQGDDRLPYRDPALPVEARVDDLLARMTLGEKIGQMTQVEVGSMVLGHIGALGIGSVLSGGSGDPIQGNDPDIWADMVAFLQGFALESRLGIPLIYGVDAVHGHSNITGAVIFPHNIGLGATRDAELVRRIGQVTAEEMAATGIWWTFAPTVAVPQDIRWGRIYEGFSEDPALVSELGVASIRGLQGDDLSAPFTVAATAKHFAGDGGTAWGSATYAEEHIDRGETIGDEATLRALHLSPYSVAVEAGVRVVMASYSSWNGLPMHGNRYLITDVLKGELGFDGFVVSDWAGIDTLAPDYYDAVVLAINAGIDMTMVPRNYPLFITAMHLAVAAGDISEERIDDAVRRILRVKFELGLFERPYPDPAWLDSVGSDAHRALAREAVAKSAVLLVNRDAALPLSHATPRIFVAGRAADDMGVQCGGWTISWQGSPGATTTGTTILEGLAQVTSRDTELVYDPGGAFPDLPPDARAPVGIAIVGELPYAEMVGDTAHPELSGDDLAAIAKLRARVDKLVVVLVSGRPLVITEHMDEWDALVAAWLPGTEGQGIADVLFGDVPFSGTLPYTWPRTLAQLPQTGLPPGEEPLFPLGYGLVAVE